MGAPTFRQVLSGEPLRIVADDWNAAMEAAKANRRTRGGVSEVATPDHFQHALVYNATGEAVDRHRVLAVARPAIWPHDTVVGMDTVPGNKDGFAERLRLYGETPAPLDLELVVTSEAIPAGYIGRCCFSGVAVCTVEIDDEDHACAQAQTGTIPVSCSRGPLQIVWKQDVADREVAGFALCLVRIRGGVPLGAAFAVTVTIDGGSAGSISATCSYTYTVFDLAGVTIGTAKTPERRRFPEVPYTETPEGSPGIAYYDESDGTLHLWDANEQPQVEECSDPEFVGPSGAQNFVDLEDVPASYAGGADKIVAVKGTEDGLEFVAPDSVGLTQPQLLARSLGA